MGNGNGRIKYSRRVRFYREQSVSVSVYLNVHEDGRKFYDTVVHRKVREEWKRGANLKPEDLPALMNLLQEAQDYLATV
jgi:hypothetical protein